MLLAVPSRKPEIKRFVLTILYINQAIILLFELFYIYNLDVSYILVCGMGLLIVEDRMATEILVSNGELFHYIENHSDLNFMQ